MKDLYWKLKYDQLIGQMSSLIEEKEFARDEQPEECISSSNEFWISNDMNVCDSESYAADNWPPGTYFRVVKQEKK
jgi:hypothetical protein